MLFMPEINSVQRPILEHVRVLLKHVGKWPRRSSGSLPTAVSLLHKASRCTVVTGVIADKNRNQSYCSYPKSPQNEDGGLE